MNIEKKSDIIVVKVGTDTITGEDGRLSLDFMKKLAQDISEIIEETNCRIYLVTSGAVAAGKTVVDPAELEGADIANKQVLASFGQHKLMRYWEDAFAFARISRRVSQLLPTAYTFKTTELCENFTNTLNYTPKNAVAIINENDTEAVDELRFGDNDQLAAKVAKLVKARCLVLLTNVDGLYDKNPLEYADANLITDIKANQISTEWISQFCAGKSNGGTGGMRSKLLASKIAADTNISTIIANGRRDQILRRILMENDFVGTKLEV